MHGDQHIWRVWARILHRWGMKDMAASFLEAAGPLNMLGAQVVYITQPLLISAVPDDHITALTRMLEDTDCTQDFVAYLREAKLP